jgi:hypothetical protein
MKRKFSFIAVILFLTLFLSSCRDLKSVKMRDSHIQKQDTQLVDLLVGSWLDQSDAKLHFTLYRNGTAKSDNMSSLIYKAWRVDENKLILTVESIGNHLSLRDEDIYTIIDINKKEMILKANGIEYKYIRRK